MLAQLTCDPVVALTFNDISHGVGTHRVAPPPSTLDATPVLGGFRFWPAWCTTGRSVCPSAVHALCSTSPLMEDGRRCHQARASLPEVLFPFDARMGSSVCAMVPRPSRDPHFSRRGCRHVTGSLGPPRASCSTCRACFIPAASMGFSLQRSVHVASRTPLGSPCPSFPWPRWRLSAFHPRVAVSPSPSSPAGDGRYAEQLCSLPGWTEAHPLHAFGTSATDPRTGAKTSTTMSFHAGIQGLKPATYACSRGTPKVAGRARTSLGLVALQGLTASALGWISPTLPSRSWSCRAGRTGTSGCQSVDVAAIVPHGRNHMIFNCLTLLGCVPSCWDLVLGAVVPSGLWFCLGVRGTLPPRHPHRLNGSARPA